MKYKKQKTKKEIKIKEKQNYCGAMQNILSISNAS